MMRAWRRAARLAVVGVLALGASAAVAGQAQAAAPTISIAATTKSPMVTHDSLVVYQVGGYATAKIHGTISGAGAGEVARLYAQPFPYKKAAAAIATVTLKASKAPYSFTVSPSLATHYWVKLFKSSTASAPVATSSPQNVYVALGNAVSGVKACGRPTCHETITLTTKVPSSALSTELSKQVYAYFGLNLSKSGIPKAPTTLTRSGGKASVSKSTRVSATEYKSTIKFTFTIGDDGFSWAWDECSKDAVTKDGLGLPGTHGCGVSKVSSTTFYLG